MSTNKDDRLAAIKACIKWMGYDKRSQLVQSNMLDFADWLGDPIKYYPEKDEWSRSDIINMNNPEIKRKVELINSSPNWYALIKVMDIRREE